MTSRSCSREKPDTFLPRLTISSQNLPKTTITPNMNDSFLATSVKQLSKHLCAAEWIFILLILEKLFNFVACSESKGYIMK